MLNYVEYKKVHELKEKGVSQNKVVKQLGLTSYAVRQIWNMGEGEFFGVEPLAHERLARYREYIVELLRSYPAIRNATIEDKLKASLKQA